MYQKYALSQLKDGASRTNILQILVMYPLDVVKTRVQLQTGSGAGGDGYTGMVDCFQKIIKNEGWAVWNFTR